MKTSRPLLFPVIGAVLAVILVVVVTLFMLNDEREPEVWTIDREEIVKTFDCGKDVDTGSEIFPCPDEYGLEIDLRTIPEDTVVIRIKK